MSGFGTVTLDGVPVVAAWEGDVRRLRVSADEWERLGLALPGRPPVPVPVPVFIAADTFTPPGWVWLTLVRQRAAAEAAGR